MEATLPQPPHPNPPQDAGAVLSHNLARLAARRNRQRMIAALVRALAWGVGLAALMVLAYRFYLVNGEWWMPLLVIAAAALVGYRNGVLQRRGPFQAALEADRALGLQERLSSALAFIQPDAVRQPRSVRPATPAARLGAWLLPRVAYATSYPATATALVPALVQDAAHRSTTVDPKTIYPAKIDRPAKTLIGLGVLLAAFCLMPNIDWLRSKEQKAFAAVAQQQGKKLEEVAKTVRDKKEAAAIAETKQLSKKLSDLARRMQRGRMTKRETLTAMAQLRQEVEKAAQNDQKNGTQTNLDQAEQALRQAQMQSAEGRQMQEDLRNGDAEKAAQQLEKLADKLEKGQMSQKEREQAANDLEKAAQALRRQGGEQNEAAARQMEDAAKALRQQNQQGGQQNSQQGKQNGQQGKQNGAQQGGSQKSQQGSQQGKQNGQQQGGQQNGAQGGQQGGGQQGQSQAGQGGANALRQMAKGLRNGGTQSGNGQNLQDMLNKIRESERDTGQNSGEQSGQGQQGQGQSGQGQQGQPGEGQGLTPGKDLVPTKQGPTGGAGLGTRSGNQPHSSGGGVSDQKSNRTGDKRRWEDVWSDRLPKTQGKINRVTGKMGSQGDTEQLETRTDAQGGAVKTPYYDVYESYKKDAEDAVSKDAVPPAYKQPVKNYFESLKPN